MFERTLRSYVTLWKSTGDCKAEIKFYSLERVTSCQSMSSWIKRKIYENKRLSRQNFFIVLCIAEVVQKHCHIDWATSNDGGSTTWQCALAALLIIADGDKVGGKINITFRRRPRYFRREIFLARRSYNFQVISKSAQRLSITCHVLWANNCIIVYYDVVPISVRVAFSFFDLENSFAASCRVLQLATGSSLSSRPMRDSLVTDTERRLEVSIWEETRRSNEIDNNARRFFSHRRERKFRLCYTSGDSSLRRIYLSADRSNEKKRILWRPVHSESRLRRGNNNARVDVTYRKNELTRIVHQLSTKNSLLQRDKQALEHKFSSQSAQRKVIGEGNENLRESSAAALVRVNEYRKISYNLRDRLR